MAFIVNSCQNFIHRDQVHMDLASGFMMLSYQNSTM